MLYLNELPENHSLRNRPLAGCWYRELHGGKTWRQIKPTYGIAGNTYNDLGPAWTETSIFCWDPVVPNELNHRTAAKAD